METSWSELMLIGIVALIVIGPKDLPAMFRELGRISAKIRAMGREFTRAMEAAARESGVKDVTDDLRKVTSPKAMGLEAVKSAADKFEKWDPLKNSAKPTKPLTPPPMSATPPAAATAAAVAATPEVGSATAALYEQKAARKAVLDEAASKLKSLSTTESPAPEAKKPGRRRKKAEVAGGDEA